MLRVVLLLLLVSLMACHKSASGPDGKVSISVAPGGLGDKITKESQMVPFSVEQLPTEELKEKYHSLINYNRALHAIETLKSFLEGTRPSNNEAERGASIATFSNAYASLKPFLTSRFIGAQKDRCQTYAKAVRDVNDDILKYVKPKELNDRDPDHQVLLMSRLLVLKEVNASLFGLVKNSSEGGDRSLSISDDASVTTCFGDWHLSFAQKLRAVVVADIDMLDKIYGRLSFDGYSSLFSALDMYERKEHRKEQFYWWAGTAVVVVVAILPVSMTALLTAVGARAAVLGFFTNYWFWIGSTTAAIIANDKLTQENPRDYSAVRSKWDAQMLVAEDITGRSLNSPQTYLKILRSQVEEQYQYELQEIKEKHLREFSDDTLKTLGATSLDDGILKLRTMVKEITTNNPELATIDFEKDNVLLPSIILED